MGLRKLIRNYREATRPIIRDIQGNVFDKAGWYSDSAVNFDLGFPVYFTGKFKKASFFLDTEDGIVVNDFQGSGSYNRYWAKNLFLINPRDYLCSLNQEIKERYNLPPNQLANTNLPRLKGVKEWMEGELKRLSKNSLIYNS